MLYCPPNVTLNEIWTKHGFSHCFMDTVGPAIWGGFLLLFGSIQLLMYRKYATPTEPTQISKSRLYALQMFLLLFFPILALTRFLLNSRIYVDHAVYGYMVSSYEIIIIMITNHYLLLLQIFYTCMVCFSYPFCICLIRKERYYQLPSLPTRGHGLILLLFWTLALINEALAFVNLRHEDWWFHLKKYVERSSDDLYV